MPVDGASAPYVIDAAGRYELTAQLPERLIGTIAPGMTVMLDAPTSAVDAVLARHPQVAALFDNGWLHLLTLDAGRIDARYHPRNGWRREGA